MATPRVAGKLTVDQLTAAGTTLHYPGRGQDGGRPQAIDDMKAELGLYRHRSSAVSAATTCERGDGGSWRSVPMVQSAGRNADPTP